MSELEPVMVFQGLKFKGLGYAGQDGGKIKVHVKVAKERKIAPLGRFVTIDARMTCDDDDDDA